MTAELMVARTIRWRLCRRLLWCTCGSGYTRGKNGVCDVRYSDVYMNTHGRLSNISVIADKIIITRYRRDSAFEDEVVFELADPQAITKTVSMVAWFHLGDYEHWMQVAVLILVMGLVVCAGAAIIEAVRSVLRSQ